MDLCLSCKGCKSECPSNVDVAKLKAEFMQHYYDANGVPFRRQMLIGKYIADFVSRKEKLIIEIDGGQHNDEKVQEYDTERTECFKKLGYTVIRFWNNEVIENLEGVLQCLHLSLTLSFKEREKFSF